MRHGRERTASFWLLCAAVALGLFLSLVGVGNGGQDATAPETTVASGPSGATNDSSPTFEFSSSEAGSSFECRVDTRPFAACSTPLTTEILSSGPHAFDVRAIDPAGNVDQTFARREFSVKLKGLPILATGDSMMRNVDVRLGNELGRIQQVSFRADVRIGSGISKDNWVRIARRQVRKHKPRATAVFLGAAEGFPMPGASCCGKAWVDEYTNRVEKMISIYSREGRAEVYWLTLPAPRNSKPCAPGSPNRGECTLRSRARRGRIFVAVNRAVRRAVGTAGPHAHLVDVRALFTPTGRYRRSIMWKGRRVVVRYPDGVHLSWQGSSIAAQLIRDAMLRDGVVR